MIIGRLARNPRPGAFARADKLDKMLKTLLLSDAGERGTYAHDGPQPIKSAAPGRWRPGDRDSKAMRFHVMQAEPSSVHRGVPHAGGVTERAKLCWPLAAALVAVPVVVASGCAREHVAGVYDTQSRVLIRIDHDADRDNRIDVRTYLRAGRGVRLEADVNGDGRIDRWEYYDERGQLTRLGRSSVGDGRQDTWVVQDGDVMRVDIATRRDGVVDRRETHERGVLVRAELDTNADGVPDQWQRFEQGRVRELQVDSDFQLGRPDRRLVYGATGTLDAIEIDPDGDGVFESQRLPAANPDGTP